MNTLPKDISAKINLMAWSLNDLWDAVIDSGFEQFGWYWKRSIDRSNRATFRVGSIKVTIQSPWNGEQTINQDITFIRIVEALYKMEENGYRLAVEELYEYMDCSDVLGDQIIQHVMFGEVKFA